MAEPEPRRRLAAVLAADVVGYSRLMGEDEAGTHARLKALRKALVEPGIAAHHGHIVKLTGDGALVEFVSVVDAVVCAAEIQRAMAAHDQGVPDDQRIAFRLGINLGDVIFDDGDIYGDGVNVAARLEGLAEPGGICVARNVYNQVKDKVGLAFEAMGEHRVKNIAEPVTVYRVLLDADPATVLAQKAKRAARASRRHGPLVAAALALLVLAGGAAWYGGAPRLFGGDGPAEAAALPLPDKPSIAVLPFDNLSREERFERLADGITEDIITDLSRFRDLFVIARNSTFVYKGQPTDVRQISRELGVQYVLEGSLQASDDRVRITAQLIDATTGNHVWSERYERPLGDVFAIQDEINEQVVGTLGGYWGRLAQDAREKARRRPTESLEAYDLYLLGVEYKHRHTKEDNKEAQQLLRRAIELDPGFARAYVVLSQTYLNDAALGFADDPRHALEEMAVTAKAAVAIDDYDAVAHMQLGNVYFFQRQIQRGAAEYNRALELGENDADLLAMLAYNRPTKLGTGREDMENLKRAMRLNPHYPEWYFYALAYAAFHSRQYQKAVAALQRFIDHPMIDGPLYSALSYAQLGRHAEAEDAAAKVLELVPNFSAEALIENDAFRDPEVIEHFLESVEKAGLPLCASEAQLAADPEMKRLERCEAERASS